MRRPMPVCLSNCKLLPGCLPKKDRFHANCTSRFGNPFLVSQIKAEAVGASRLREPDAIGSDGQDVCDHTWSCWV